jgi:hypothetical protein
LLNRQNSFIKGSRTKLKPDFANNTALHRSPKASAFFLPVGKLLVKERYRFKKNSFFAFAACELERYSL